MRISLPAFVIVSVLGPLIGMNRCFAAFTCDLNQAIVDDVKFPFGSEVDLIGEAIDTDGMELSPGLMDLKLARINSRANQDCIFVHLNGPTKPEEIKSGQWYRVHGKLMDAKARRWHDVGKQAVTGWEYNPTRSQISFLVETIEPIPAAPIVPADLLNRTAEFEGTAELPDRLTLDASEIHVTPWPADIAGKQIGLTGKVSQKGSDVFIDSKDWHLIDPADMVGRTVTLEGNLYGRGLKGDEWRFEYRNIWIVLTDAHDPPARFTEDYRVIEAIGAPQTPESTAALIELLQLDLSRFGGEKYDRQGYQRVIAAQLIDATGESFGIDAAAWQKWFAARKSARP